MIKKLFLFIGRFFGTLSLIIPRKVSYPWYLTKRAFVTARYKGSFTHIGKDSLLAPEVRVISPEFISIGDNSSIMNHCTIEAYSIGESIPSLEIGNNTSIGEFTHITCANRITIGCGTGIGRFVLITDNSHGGSRKKDIELPIFCREIISNGPVHIGDNVWIGDKVTILPNVTIGKGCIIAANAVVTKDIPEHSVAAGVPAKVIKTIKE